LIIATVAAFAFAVRIAGAQRWWAISASALLAVAAAFASPAQRSLWQVRHDWDGWRRRSTVDGLATLRIALDDALRAATQTARQALDASHDRGQAFDQLSHIVGGPDERGVVLFRGDTVVAWAGTIHPTVDWVREGTSVVATSFYLAIQVSVRRDDTRAAAVSLLFAEPPADGLSAPLAQRIASETGLSGFTFALPTDSSNSPEVLHYTLPGGNRLFDVRAAPLAQGEISEQINERVRARAGFAFLLALGCFIIGVWRGTRSLPQRVAALAVGLACTALVPLNQYSNLTRLFDPAVYFTPKGGPLTGNAGALATTSAIVLLGILAVFRRQARRVSRPVAVATILLVAGLGPFLLRELARGVQIPLHGVDTSLWLIWEIPLFLAAVSVLLTGAAAGAAVLGPRRGLSPWVAPLAATVAAVLAQAVWDAPGRWPWWYTFLWIGAIATLALSRSSRFVILSASTVAALGATTLVWGRTAKGRVEASERDLAGLSQVDSVSVMLLRRFGESLRQNFAPTTRQGLLQQFVASDIATAGNPVALFAWPSDSGPVAGFATAQIPIPADEMARLVALARRTGARIVEPVATDSAMELVMAAPSVNGVTAVVLAPKTRLFESDPFARLLGLDVETDVEPPYTVRLRERGPTDVPRAGLSWRRDGTVLHGEGLARTGTGETPVHVEVELRALDALVERGALLVMLDLALVGVLWMASVIADGGAGRWLRARRRTWGRSYRARLSLALFAFFVVPAIVFAVSSYEQLATDATQSRALLVRETLRAVSGVPPAPLWLPAESQRLNTPLFFYRGGELRDASDPLYAELAPLGRYLAPKVELDFSVGDEETSTLIESVDGVPTLFGYRTFPQADAPSAVFAAPARADELTLGRRRRDLGVLVLFSTAVGALAALWLSGLAGRELARPIGQLREAALSIAGGARTPPLETEPTVEFLPVFNAFRRMASDLHASRSALEEAQRRTAAVLRNVASGVVAVDSDGLVSLANPRAEALLATSLSPGTPFRDHAPATIADIVTRFLESDGDEKAFEAALDQQQLRGTLTRLARGGAVVTLDDVTELARAQRVLAWGEMARQVAHEIKNPLTPIRLGVQHLRRARADSRIDFDRVLEHNVNQILTEIDRLDEIARAFSRYGAAPEERQRATPIDVAAVVREVVSLERMGEQSAGGLDWQEQGVDVPVLAFARPDELKEVLLNVLENARLADAKRVIVSVERTQADDGSRRVTIIVRDNGRGIAPDVLPRIFEPHFSTRTSGSGLGLAISRQIVEGWGGTIAVESVDGEGSGAKVTISLPTPDGPKPASA
jgi:two-component system nitrogen regulation sensor histidine kinase NtrY